MDSAPRKSAPLQAAQVVRQNSPSAVELRQLYIFLLGLLSLPIAAGALIAILKSSQHTQFPPSDSRKGFVPGPTTRGTMNVVWVCISTIFTCVYVAVHIDVPNLDPPIRQKFYQDISLGVRSHARLAALRAYAAIWCWIERPWCKRIGWLLFNVSMPELIVLVAVLELFSARDGQRFMRNRGQKNWSLKLAFFADMGGFEWRGEGVKPLPFRSGIEFLKWFDETGRPLQVAPLEREIAARSQTNAVLKVFTAMQAFWLLVEIIARGAESKAVSVLEITTCSYIVCALVGYGCWVRKPYNVGSRIVLRKEDFDDYQLHICRPSTPSASTRLLPPDSTLTDESVASDPAQKTEVSNFPPATEVIRLPKMIYDGAQSSPYNRACLDPDTSYPLACCLAGFVGAIVGLIHAAPLWNAQFVNTAGQWLWRVCCIVQVVTPVSVAAVSVVERWHVTKPMLTAIYIAVYVVSFVYCVSRVFLFALIVISFWSLPASVYTNVEWSSSYFPHWH